MAQVASRALSKGLEMCSFMTPEAHTVVIGDPDRLRQAPPPPHRPAPARFLHVLPAPSPPGLR